MTEGSQYVFRATIRIDPTQSGVQIDPNTFATTIYRGANQPGEPGWQFFRDNLWHGELADPDHFRELTADALDVTVDTVEFAELQATEAYRAALLDAIQTELDSYSADTPRPCYQITWEARFASSIRAR